MFASSRHSDDAIMKTHVLFLLLSIAPWAASAQRQGQNQIGPVVGYEYINAVTQAGLDHDWRRRQLRLVGGVTNNLNDAGWSYLEGSVFQNVSAGQIVSCGFGDVLLLRGPRAADKEAISCWAKDTGEMFTYNTVGGSTRTIRKFDCGVVVSNVPVVRAEPVRAMSPEEKQAMAERVLKFQMERAEKGYDGDQYLIGRRYQQGDGVPRDPARAREFFERAAKQGNSDAKAALANWPLPK